MESSLLCFTVVSYDVTCFKVRAAIGIRLDSIRCTQQRSKVDITLYMYVEYVASKKVYYQM